MGVPVASAGRRWLALSALLLALAPVVHAPAAAAERPVVFEVLSTAVGLSVSSTQRPAASVVTGGLVDASSGYSSSALSSAGASASASAAFYPGDLVATGPTLLCSEFVPCPVAPPAYPLVAQASWPERPTGTADSASPVGTARAVARELATEGATELSRVSAPGAPVAVSTGMQSTGTRVWVDATGGHVRTSSTLHDVVVGPLHVRLLTASDDVDVATSGRVTDRPQVQLTGVTFAGVAATVDDQGVHLPGVTQPLPERSLAAQGVEVRALGLTRTDRSGAARSTVGGLQVTFTAPVSGVPPVVPGVPSVDRAYLGSLTVGGVGAAVAVGAPGALLLSALPAPPAASLEARLFPSATVAHAAAGSSAAPAGTGEGRALAEPMHRRTRIPQPDLRWLALALAVVPTSMLLGWRAAVHRRAS